MPDEREEKGTSWVTLANCGPGSERGLTNPPLDDKGS